MTASTTTTTTTSNAELPPRAPGPVGDLGSGAIDLFISARELYSMFVRTLYYTARGKRPKGAVLEQLYLVGNKSLFFICIECFATWIL